MSAIDLSAAVEALAPLVCHKGGHIPNRDRSLPGSCDFHRSMALAYVETAAQLIEAQVRAQIAAELRAAHMIHAAHVVGESS